MGAATADRCQRLSIDRSEAADNPAVSLPGFLRAVCGRDPNIK